MNDARLAELREKYKDRNLLEELEWGTYANHGGYTNKWDAEFLNWLCNAAYRAIKENKPSGEWIERVIKDDSTDYEEVFYECSECGYKDYIAYNYCPNCGAKMDGGKTDATD